MYLIDDLNMNYFFDVSKVDLNLINDIIDVIPDDFSFKLMVREKLNTLLEQDSFKFENLTDEQIDAKVEELLKITDEQIDAEVDDILKQERINESFLKQIKQIDYNQFKEIIDKMMVKLPFRDEFFKSICCDEIIVKCMYNVVQNDFQNANQIIETSILNEIQNKSQQYSSLFNEILKEK